MSIVSLVRKSPPTWSNNPSGFGGAILIPLYSIYIILISHEIPLNPYFTKPHPWILEPPTSRSFFSCALSFASCAAAWLAGGLQMLLKCVDPKKPMILGHGHTYLGQSYCCHISYSWCYHHTCNIYIYAHYVVKENIYIYLFIYIITLYIILYM